MNREQHEAVQPGLQRHFPYVLIFWPLSIWQASSEYCQQKWTVPDIYLSSNRPKTARPRLCLCLGFLLKSCLPSGWWILGSTSLGETTLSVNYVCRLHRNPNIHTKHTYICYHKGHSLVRDMLTLLGKISFSVLLSRLYYTSLHKGLWEVKWRAWHHCCLGLEWIHLPVLLCSSWATLGLFGVSLF